MATITEIKTRINTDIRTKVLPGSITKTNDADQRDEVADELLVRGVITVLATGDLATQTHENTLLVLVAGIGLFMAYETPDAADNENSFASADAGWLWQRVITATDGRDKFSKTADFTYVLADGFMIDKIMLKPSVEQTIKIGKTPGGDEIMFPDILPVNVWRTVTYDLIADGGDVNIYFEGLTDPTTIIIYKRRI